MVLARHLLPRQVTYACRTALASRRDGSGDPSYVIIFPARVILQCCGEADGTADVDGDGLESQIRLMTGTWRATFRCSVR